jgi:hypothetical protein
MSKLVFEYWPLTRTTNEILKQPVNNILPRCPSCIGGRLVFDNLLKQLILPELRIYITGQ